MQRLCVDDCSWPELAARYDVALREAVGFILKRFPQTVAIAAAGTILRGTSSAARDLDREQTDGRPITARLTPLLP